MYQHILLYQCSNIWLLNMAVVPYLPYLPKLAQCDLLLFLRVIPQIQGWLPGCP